MDIIVCLDELDGMSFNNRRQSMDRTIREDVLELIGNKKLYMSPYSAKQFVEGATQIVVAHDCLSNAQEDDFVFIEETDVKPYEHEINRIIVYRWQKRYPADKWFDIKLSEPIWKCTEEKRFAGYSHELIVREIFERIQED